MNKTIRYINLFDIETAAAAHLDANAFGYYASGADDEVTMRDNRAAFERIKLAPRVLVNVSQRNLSTTVLGQSIPAPLIVAPMALAGLAHPNGDEAVARAAGAKGTGMTLSTMSTSSMERVAEVAGQPLWFQLYVYRNREITQKLIARAEAAGFQALVVTVDTPMSGKRERDVRNGFSLPDHIQLANFVGMDLATMDEQANESAIAAYAASQLDPSLTWEDLRWMVDNTNLPVIVKGVLRADDAQTAIDHGARGIIVSNHGGRQLDTTPATIDVLPHIAAAVGEQVDVLVDGGVRRGTDILKALALGAKAVMVGRPVFYGLSLDGQAGVEAVLEILLSEFDRAMTLSGCTTVEEITPDLIFRKDA